jgi:hypothetical protein
VETFEVLITSGSPSESEARAIRAAIETLIAKDAADRSTAPNPWVLAARVAGTGRADGGIARGSQAWRLAGRLSPPVTNLQPGRGDAR